MNFEFVFAMLFAYGISGIIAICLGVIAYLMHNQTNSRTMSLNDETKNEKSRTHYGYWIFLGITAIIGGLAAESIVPWADQSTLSVIETCIADMHFRNHTETEFRDCVSPDVEKIQALQHLIVITTIFYSVGGIFIGVGLTKKFQKND